VGGRGSIKKKVELDDINWHNLCPACLERLPRDRLIEANALACYQGTLTEREGSRRLTSSLSFVK